MSLPRLRLPIILGTSIFIAGSWIVFDSGSFPCAAAVISKATILGPRSVEVAAYSIGEKRSNEPKPIGNDVAIPTLPNHLVIPTGLQASSIATIVKKQLFVCRTDRERMSSVTTLMPTSIEVLPV